eukprot:7304879-Pyramimonas_sp.AAC.1
MQIARHERQPLAVPSERAADSQPRVQAELSEHAPRARAPVAVKPSCDLPKAFLEKVPGLPGPSKIPS